VGVSGGDEVLRLLGSRLRKTCGGSGLVTRLAADEFGLLLQSDGDMDRIQADVRALAVAIRDPMQFGGMRLDLSASIGVAVAPTDGDSPETLMINADLALNRARKAQSHEPCFYATGMNEDFKARAQLTRELQTAIRSQSIRIFFQPIIRSKDRRLLGFEALARWRHPERGDVPPALFIPLAEELGLISQITQYMLREACFHLSSWNRQFGRDWLVAVNLSGKELSSPDLHKQVASVLSKTGLDPQCLELEVTENALTENMDLAATNLGQLRSIGVSLAIDDFGTGYSSLVALRRLPVSRLKIDRSFMKDYGTDQEDTAIVNSIIQLAKTLDLQLTAEGIEDEKTFTRIRSKGCQTVQGYLFGRPQSANDTLAYLARRAEEEKAPASRARAS
jgi:predicted signal transduction protein with EAL and GGDEF domain